ncbi:hypothetical protein [Natronorubrum halophilum]|uniref:hypothetical protein n=1 Tax=Natronorubrum halophilum TaxID=1702106 RepID=UPI000EF75172|nr:hypothetical protein [Natronorubrum halophilum]
MPRPDPRVPALDGKTNPFADVAARPLPENVVPLADAYDERIADRDRTLWHWFHRIEPEIRLSCVEPERTRRACEAKILAMMFITVADDVAERYGDRATFAELRNVPFEHQHADPTRDDVDGEYVRFQRDLWSQFLELYDAGARADEFADLLRFDLRQALQAVDYSALLAHHPGLASERELWTYDAHNMLVFVFATIDLANASAFDSTDLSAVRRVVARCQRMARIGNWIATWERELAEGDYSSGVVVRAFETDLLSVDELRAIRTRSSETPIEPIVTKIRESGIEEYFVDRWRSEYTEAAQFIDEIDSVDIGAYLEGFETVFRAQLAKGASGS